MIVIIIVMVPMVLETNESVSNIDDIKSTQLRLCDDFGREQVGNSPVFMGRCFGNVVNIELYVSFFIAMGNLLYISTNFSLRLNAFTK